ncbi:MAG: DNA-processing protein DprA [Candidatus Dojkabacteria bacterium]|nr:DNA-processing protein DprA [Candidatus Dojkabacteria bacterium]MDQ7021777.1 DNA-processing protein DprA [Candidatus Dojkabacteria bacterium]
MEKEAKIAILNKVLILELLRNKGIGDISARRIMHCHFAQTKVGYTQEISNKESDLLTNAIRTANKKLELLKSYELTDSLVPFFDENYPGLLNEVQEAPALIFTNGNKNLLSKRCISIVGTRNATAFGKSFASELSYELAKAGLVIVSGLAVGIDSHVHHGALKAGGHTISVLPSEVEKATPVSNTNLYNNILNQNGLIISEYSKYRPINLTKGLFPARNRIIAGLSEYTIIVEAKEKSGAIITANLAFENNRDVLSLPGSVNFNTSSGCNQLIRENKARLIRSVSDVFEDIGIKNYNKNKLRNLSTLTESERIVYDTLLSGGKFIEELNLILQIGFTNLISLCSSLELKEFIMKDDIGKYVIQVS